MKIMQEIFRFIAICFYCQLLVEYTEIEIKLTLNILFVDIISLARLASY
jgi:hypothetical protein